MKIGLVCPYNLYKGGGVQECVFALQKELTKRGYSVLIITPHSKSFPDVLPPFVRLLGNAAGVKSFHTTAQVSISADSKQIDDLLEKEKFDLLHFHEPWVPLLSRQILLRNKAKHVATFHAKLPDTVVSKTIEKVITPYTKSILKYLDVLTAVSDPAADYVHDLTSKDVTIVPNGIDTSKYVNGSAKNGNKILYIGRLERRKGLKYLLSAFRVLKQNLSDAELVIAGDGPDMSKLQDQVRSENIQDVTFPGYVSDAKKMELLSESSLFCSPAIYGESFGIVLLEAMASSLPIVAADNPGYQTVLTGRGALSLVDVKHSQEFARRLNLLLTDKTLRQAWRDWADQHIKQYDYVKIVDQYEALYNRLLRT